MRRRAIARDALREAKAERHQAALDELRDAVPDELANVVRVLLDDPPALGILSAESGEPHR